jgi:PAS domain S-box-containing protein
MDYSKAGHQFPIPAQFCLQHSLEMIVWVRPDGTILFANLTCLQQLGYSEKELLDQPLSFLLTTDHPEDWQEKWNKAQQEQHRKLHYSVKSSAGQPLAVKGREFYLQSESGEILCLFWELKSKENADEAGADGRPRRLYLEEINLQRNSSGIISKNQKYRKVLKQVNQVAGTNATVLIEGETGTGKELLANAIHLLSERRKSPFVKVNCAAIPNDLAGSELFGHEKGAFTGAFQKKIGRFELAHGGTLLLDEVGELPLHLQPKLLRVLQEGEFERLGSNKTIKVDIRLIAATNRDLKKMIREGTFREDLYFRLSVFPIYNLPLRERKDDIPLLVKFFIEKFNQKMGRDVKQVAVEDMDVLMDYNFPGNIRELENIIERAIILSKGEELNLKTFFIK